MVEKRRPVWSTLPLFFGILFAASQAQALVSVQTTDRTTFTTAAGPVLIDTFGTTTYFDISTGSISAAGGGAVPAGLIQPGVTYSSPVGTGAFDFNIDSGTGFTGGFLDRVVLNGAAPSTVALTATFATPVRGFGFDTNDDMFVSSTADDFAVIITYSGGTTQTLTSNVPLGSTPSFYGYYSGLSDIVSATIYTTATNSFPFAVDNFTFSSTAVPEPATLGVAAMVVMATLSGRRRVT